MNFLDGVEKLDQAFPGPSGKSTELQSWRQSGRQAFSQNTWPTRKDENWKYSNLKSFLEVPWNSTSALGPAPSSALEKVKKSLNSAFENLVFINGQYQKSISSLVPTQLLKITPIAELSSSELTELRNQFQLAHRKEDIFSQLNTAWLAQGLLIDVPEELSFPKPLCLNFFYEHSGVAMAAHTRVFLRVGQRSKISLIEKSWGEGLYFQNSMTSVVQHKDSSVTHVSLQENTEESFSFMKSEFNLLQGAHLNSTVLSLGAKLSRSTLSIYHLGHGSSSKSNGLYLVGGKRQSEHYTDIEHVVGDCQSQQLYKGILNDEARGVFNGRVCIHKGAAKANSEQLNNNLLLSSQAEVDSKPELEILADDVKATHGSTVGQLDEEEIFYLQSRSLSREMAIQLLSAGFALEILYLALEGLRGADEAQNTRTFEFFQQSMMKSLKGLGLQ
jgi:Fe-S cluster assembly protein SufD